MSFNRFFVAVLRRGHAGAPTFEEARQDYASMLGRAVLAGGPERRVQAAVREAQPVAPEDAREGPGRAA